MPGFVDTHRHTWEAAIRGCAPNATLDDYFVEILDTFAPLYRAEDVYASQPRRLAGVPQRRHHHAGRLVAHQQHARAPGRRDPRRCRRPGSARSTRTAARTPRWPTTGSRARSPIPGDDVRRIRDTYFSSDDGLLTMALATRGPGFCMDDVVRAEWELARELGIPITVHVAMGRLAGRFGMIKQLQRPGPARVRTRPTSTAATSATRSGSWSPTAAARSRSRRRSRCRWATAGRR